MPGQFDQVIETNIDHLLRIVELGQIIKWRCRDQIDLRRAPNKTGIGWIETVERPTWFNIELLSQFCEIVAGTQLPTEKIRAGSWDLGQEFTFRQDFTLT